MNTRGIDSLLRDPGITRQSVDKILQSRSESDVSLALLFLIENFDDVEWMQEKCIEVYNREDIKLKSLAVTCLGHIGRLHKWVSFDKIAQLLHTALYRDRISSSQDAIDDLSLFVKDFGEKWLLFTQRGANGS